MSLLSTSGIADNQGMLKGINEVSILVETLSSDEKTCGLDEDLIKNEIAYIIGRDLKITEKDSGVCYLYADPYLLQREEIDLCYGTLSLELRCFGRFINTVNNGDTGYYTASLWKTISLVSASKSVVKENYMDAISDYAKEFVVDWRQNQ